MRPLVKWRTFKKRYRFPSILLYLVIWSRLPDRPSISWRLITADSRSPGISIRYSPMNYRSVARACSRTLKQNKKGLCNKTVGKIAQERILTIWHCILSTELTKTHGMRECIYPLFDCDRPGRLNAEVERHIYFQLPVTPTDPQMLFGTM